MADDDSYSFLSSARTLNKLYDRIHSYFDKENHGSI